MNQSLQLGRTPIRGHSQRFLCPRSRVLMRVSGSALPSRADQKYIPGYVGLSTASSPARGTLIYALPWPAAAITQGRRQPRLRLLRVRARINSHFGASAGRADARRRDAGDVVTSSRSGNAADARPPPRPEGLPAHILLIAYAFLSPGSRAWDRAAQCEVIFARALSQSAPSAPQSLLGQGRWVQYSEKRKNSGVREGPAVYLG
jgi:hypothetical protein